MNSIRDVPQGICPFQDGTPVIVLLKEMAEIQGRFKLKGPKNIFQSNVNMGLINIIEG